MITLSFSASIIWAIAAIATGGVILRPWQLPEALWAVLGALALVLLGLLPWSAALAAVAKGSDVYLFLAGMMLLSDLARQEGLFEHIAALAVKRSQGSSSRLFALVYGVGTVVTVFMSNDATAVVLTPAVYAASRVARAEPLPHLLACAFIANAASFVLPISNPANLVVFGAAMPRLFEWLQRFWLPSVASIFATYWVLRRLHSVPLRAPIASDIEVPPLQRSGRWAAIALGTAAVLLLSASARGAPLGLVTFITGALAVIAVHALRRRAPWVLLREVSWSILPLVAGLFVLVAALDRTGVTAALGVLLQHSAQRSVAGAVWGSGIITALACNVLNNLPTGLIAGSTVTASHMSPQVTSAIMIGVDLGPNLSVTGSLASILWLIALRREKQHVSARNFLKLGALLMPAALLPALAILMLRG